MGNLVGVFIILIVVLVVLLTLMFWYGFIRKDKDIDADYFYPIFKNVVSSLLWMIFFVVATICICIALEPI